jgi:hypothetical protein
LCVPPYLLTVMQPCVLFKDCKTFSTELFSATCSNLSYHNPTKSNPT